MKVEKEFFLITIPPYLNKHRSKTPPFLPTPNYNIDKERKISIVRKQFWKRTYKWKKTQHFSTKWKINIDQASHASFLCKFVGKTSTTCSDTVCARQVWCHHTEWIEKEHSRTSSHYKKFALNLRRIKSHSFNSQRWETTKPLRVQSVEWSDLYLLWGLHKELPQTYSLSPGQPFAT